MRKDILKILGVSAEGKENAGSAAQAKASAEGSTWWGAAVSAAQNIARQTAVAAQTVGLISDDPGAKAITEVSAFLQKSQTDQLSPDEQAAVINIFLNNNADDARNSAFGSFLHILNDIRKANGNRASLRSSILITALKDLKKETGVLDPEHFIALLKSADPVAEIKRIIAEEREIRAKQAIFAPEDPSFEDLSASVESSRTGVKTEESIVEASVDYEGESAVEGSSVEEESSALVDEAGLIEESLTAEHLETGAEEIRANIETEVTETIQAKDLPIVVEAIALGEESDEILKNIDSPSSEHSLESLSDDVNQWGAKLAKWEVSLEEFKDENPRAMTDENSQIFTQMRDALREQQNLLKAELKDFLGPLPAEPSAEESEDEMRASLSDASSSVESEGEDSRFSAEHPLPPTPRESAANSSVESEEEEEPVDLRAQAFERKLAEVRASLNKNPPLKDVDKRSISSVLQKLSTEGQLEDLEDLEKKIQKLQGESLQSFVDSLQRRVEEAGLQSSSKGSLDSKRMSILRSESTMEKKYERLLEIEEEFEMRKEDMNSVQSVRELINILPEKLAKPFLERLNVIEYEIRSGKDTLVEEDLMNILIDVENIRDVWRIVKSEIQNSAMQLQDPEKEEILTELSKMPNHNQYENTRESFEALANLKKRVSRAQAELRQKVKEGSTKESIKDMKSNIQKLTEDYDSELARKANHKLASVNVSDEDLSELRKDLVKEILSDTRLVENARQLHEDLGRVRVKGKVKDYDYDMEHVNKQLQILENKIIVLEKIDPTNTNLRAAKAVIKLIDRQIATNEAQRNKSILTLASEKLTSVIQTVRRDEGKTPTAGESEASSKPERSPRAVLNRFVKKMKTADDASGPKSKPVGVGWAKPTDKTEAEPKLGVNKSAGKPK